MRILINAAGIKWGGGVTDIYNILNELSRTHKGDKYYIFISDSAKKKLPSLADNFHILTFPLAENSWLVHLLFNQLILIVFILLKRIDTILTFNFATFFAPRRQVVRITQPACFSRINLKNAASCGIAYLLRMAVYRNLILSSVKRAEKVIFISNSLKQDISSFLKRGLKADKAIVSYNGIDGSLFNRKSNGGYSKAAFLENRKFTILYPSFYYPHKNFLLLFKAVAELKKRKTSEFVFLLTIRQKDIWPHEEREILSLIDTFGLRQNFRFLGNLSYLEMPRIYGLADMVVFPSLAEACPNPLPEAMCLGLPIAASDIPAHKEICQDAAVYFDVSCAGDLAEKIILLSQDEGLRQRLSANARARAKEFSWHKHVNDIYTAMTGIKNED